MPRRSAPRLVLALVVAAGIAACGRDVPPPVAEFVLAAGDSSWWIRTGPDVGEHGVAVRGAPLVLARLDGRFHELFITEEDYSFPDAAFTSETVWRRDLETDDSTVVFGDPTVSRLALAWAHANPGARPLDPDELGADEPTASAALEVTVLDVLGPWLVIETFADVHPARGPQLHRARRGVVDLRDGRVGSLARLVGDSAARAAVARGRAAFAQARDSLRRVVAAARDDDRNTARAASAAMAALARVGFDERSFAVQAAGRAPSVVFHVPVDDEGGHTLPLAPIPLPDGAWWHEVRDVAPTVAAAANGATNDAADAVAEWRRGAVAVRLRPSDRDDAHDVVLRAGGREWAVARLSTPVERLHWIDDLAPRSRSALLRAFDVAQRYDGVYHAAAYVTDVPRTARAPRSTRSPRRPVRLPHPNR